VQLLEGGVGVALALALAVELGFEAGIMRAPGVLTVGVKQLEIDGAERLVLELCFSVGDGGAPGAGRAEAVGPFEREARLIKPGEALAALYALKLGVREV